MQKIVCYLLFFLISHVFIASRHGNGEKHKKSSKKRIRIEGEKDTPLNYQGPWAKFEDEDVDKGTIDVCVSNSLMLDISTVYI